MDSAGGSNQSMSYAHTPTTAKNDFLPSPTFSDATLRSSQEGLGSKFNQGSNDESRPSSSQRPRATSSPSSSSKDKESDANSNIDIEKQESRRSYQKSEQNKQYENDIVVFDGPDDKENPQNWTTLRKSCITLSMGSMTLCVTFASSIFSTATMVTAKQFGVSSLVMTLGTSLFVLGFAFGPLVWGPLSELYGRRLPLFTGFFIFAIFNIPVAVAQNLQTIFVCRFFGGFFACAPLAVVGGALADVWDPVNRGIAIAVFSSATFVGPVSTSLLMLVDSIESLSMPMLWDPTTTAPSLQTHRCKAIALRFHEYYMCRGCLPALVIASKYGLSDALQVLSPIMGGFITMSFLGWRWTQWITLIMASFFGTIGFFVVPETYAPVLLTRKARRLRQETKNWALHSKAEESPVGMKTIITKYFARPFQMMLMEPILILVTIYMSVIYGIIYLFFSAYPIAFQEDRGWNAGVGALPFLGLIIGVCLGAGLIAYTSKTTFKRALEREGKVIPESRLPPMMVGGFVFPAGMFWFAWTSSPNITWVPQVIAGIPIGMGLLLIFLQGT